MIDRAYRFAQVLSLDIVIGVVILLRFFCAQFQVDPGWEVYALLGASVWLIYTADHLRDAESSGSATRIRYVFHRMHRKTLTVVSILVLIAIAPLVFFIPTVIFIGGLILVVFSFIYLLVQHRLSGYLSKEIYVSIVYSIGVLMVPMCLSWIFDLTLFLLLFLLTYVNLVIFSWYEKNEDQQDGFQSIATQMSEKKLERTIVLLLATGLSISFLTFSITSVFFIIGFIIYASMLLFPHFFKKNHMFRTIGDGVFLLPILFEWL
ncbi:hypothetical protein [Ekhidna sp. To15]|uniref:hypothetical protein n=1 Tax=Ekhidna sp. To15 TaxID=3395267 RepID=UPI003F524D2E